MSKTAEKKLKQDIAINGELRMCDAIDCMNYYKRDGGNYCKAHREIMNTSQQLAEREKEIDYLKNKLRESESVCKQIREHASILQSIIDSQSKRIKELEEALIQIRDTESNSITRKELIESLLTPK